MDKTGIFNLLNGLFTFYQQNKKDSPEQPPIAEAQPSPNLNKPSATISVTQKPLQQGMLNTMNNHDDFVKRVLSKNRK